VERLIAWILVVSFGGLFFNTTKADVLEKIPYMEAYKLGYSALPDTFGIFNFAYERMAEQLCPAGYSILRKSSDRGYTVWLIQCGRGRI
jgi:hypothetical protein